MKYKIVLFIVFFPLFALAQNKPTINTRVLSMLDSIIKSTLGIGTTNDAGDIDIRA